MTIKNLTVVIPFYNGLQYLPRLVFSLPENIPILIVDDQSDENMGTWNVSRPGLKMVRLDEKGYFSGAVNHGIFSCNTDVLVLNQDTWFESGPEGLFWTGIIDQYRDRYAMIGERIKGQNAAWPNGYIHGTFMFLRRDAIEKIGGLDADRYPLWGATALWQLQACRAGFGVLPLEEIPGFHHARDPKEHFGSSIKKLLKDQPSQWEKYLQIPPLVSVVIPSYNHGRYLRDAVHSLIGGKTSLGNFAPQTFQSFEIIIVDDGSSDDTSTVCRDLCNSWHGIRYLRHSRNQGTAAAHNTGIKAALGKYITTMSADDMRESWSLQDLVTGIEANPHSLVYDELTWFTKGKRQGLWIKNWEEYDFNTLLNHNLVPVGTIFTKKAWEEVGGYPESLKFGREDWGFAVAMGRAGYCGVKLSRPGYLYRREGQNRTEINSSPEWREKFKVQMVKLFPDLYSGRFPMACCGRGGASPAQNNLMAAQNQGISMSMARSFPGAIGMTLIEYTGRNVGSTSWGGPKLPSQKVYLFGNNERDRVKLVDDRDVSWFLSKRAEGKNLFKRHNVPDQSTQSTPEGPEPIPMKPLNAADVQAGGPVDMAKVQAIQSSKEINLGELGVATVQIIPDPSELLAGDETPVKSVLPADIDTDAMTVKDVLELILTHDQWQEIYNREKAGKNRVTLIRVLEEKLAA